MCRYVLLAMTVVCLLNSEMCRGMAPPATRVSPDTLIPVLRQMSQEELLMTVVSGLQMRDAQLQNFSCELTYEVTYVDPRQTPPKTQLLWKRSTVEKRLGRKSLIHDREFSADGKSKFEFRTNWDGSRSRVLNLPEEGKPQYRGSINDTEPSSMSGLYYNNMLGYRVGCAPLTLSEWIEASAKDKSLQGVAIVEREGQALIEIHVLNDEHRHRRYWLDPARGYVPVRHECAYIYKEERSNWVADWMAEAKKLDEVWVPIKVLSHSGTSSPDYGATVYTVSRFDLGTVKEQDLEIVFPAGTLVVDRVKHEAFRVNADGTRTLTELYNPLTGVVTLGDKKVGGSQRGPQSAATKPFSSGQDAASVPASVAAGKGAGSSNMATIVGALAAAGALGLGVYLLFRHRTTATLVVILAYAVVLAGHAQAAESAGNSIAAQLNGGDATGIRESVASIRGCPWRGHGVTGCGWATVRAGWSGSGGGASGGRAARVGNSVMRRRVQP